MRTQQPIGHRSGAGARPRSPVLVLLPLGAAEFYLTLGSPQLPGQPQAARLATCPEEARSRNWSRGRGASGANPEDGRGWEVLGPVYMRLGRLRRRGEGAAQALRAARRNAEREADLGEALTGGANGIVTAEAKAAFERALGLDAARRAVALFPGPCRRAGWTAERSGRGLACAAGGSSGGRAMGRIRA